MPSLTKKIIRGKPYYYFRESHRVEGKRKIVSTIYLGPPQSILDRLMRPQPAQLAIYEFGASAAVWDMAQAIDLLATIDRHVPKRASQALGRSVHADGSFQPLHGPSQQGPGCRLVPENGAAAPTAAVFRATHQSAVLGQHGAHRRPTHHRH